MASVNQGFFTQYQSTSYKLCTQLIILAMSHPYLTQLLAQLPWSFVDLETTGISPTQGHRTCELAVLRVEPDGTTQLLESLVNPLRPIDPHASRVNGIYDTDVSDSPTFAQLIPALNAILADTILIAHNAPFDTSFLAVEYALARAEIPVVPLLDTLKIAREHFRFPNNKLGTIAQVLEVPVTIQHRAAADAQTTYHIFKKMTEYLGLKKNKQTLADFNPDLFAPYPTSKLPLALHTALVESSTVMIRYSIENAVNERCIEPLWCDGKYLIAFCQLRQEHRTFRIDRILEYW